jgi:copper(I)-binding protein
MRFRSTLFPFAAVLFALSARALPATGQLEISQAWIRMPPPGATMLAGYAVLRNAGDAAIAITGATSDDFGSISLHESIQEDGMERMRPLGTLSIAPRSSVEFRPGGKHLMLMQPKRTLHPGDKVAIRFASDPPGGVTGEFVVGEAAP